MVEIAVADKLDSVTFSLLEVKVKLESCSVVFMLFPCTEKRILDHRLCIFSSDMLLFLCSSQFQND